jgi:ribose transport system permease protein
MTGVLLRRTVRSPLLYLGGLLVVSLIYFSAANEFFGTIDNFKTIGAGAAGLGVVAIGVTLALAAGAIDFSVAGNAALCGMIGAWLTGQVPSGLALVLVLVLAAAIGLGNGLLITRFGINPFIMTLAIAGSLRGIAYVMGGDAASIRLEGDAVRWLGNGSIATVPVALIVLLLVAAAGAVVLRRLPFGRNLLAVGGNPEAARLAGVPVARTQIAGYVISAACAGLGGLILAGRSGAGLPGAASGEELLVFSTVILGGTSLWGGRASVGGSLIAILLINVLYSGLTLQQVSSYWQTILQGVLLIIAVWLVQEQQEGRSLLWLIRRPPARHAQAAAP